MRDPDAVAEATWKKTSGNDHFFHSMAFNMLSRRICEHMYQTQDGAKGTSSAISGVTPGLGTPNSQACSRAGANPGQ
jgi:hypothetical protein